MKKLTFLFTFSLLFTLLLSACGKTSSATPTIDQNSVGTQAAQTIAAVLTSQAITPQPTVEASATAVSQPETATTPTTAPTVAPSETPTLQPSPTPLATGSAPCEDQAQFVEDVTVPDNTIFLPSEAFTKTWRIKNTGTCTWSTSYAIVFDKGDQLGGVSPSSLPSEVKPDTTVDISLRLTAPGSTGTYRGEWKLRNADGQVFGLGKKADAAFWVQIVVQEGTADLNLGNPTWRDNFDSGANWYMLKTDDTEWEVKDGQLVMKAKNVEAAEEWGLSNKAAIKDFYLEAKFKTGTCAALDRYGVLVRAPDTDKGYVFEFSCDGRFRLYKWDGENYEAIQEWKASNAINAGSDQSNRLGIWMKGKTIRLYANGQLLGEYEDSTYDEGRFGLVIGARETKDFTVYIDELAYWILGD